MKNIAAVLALTAMLTGCYHSAEVETQVGDGFNVQELFTHKGCTVFRFKDGGRHRYYTNCTGATNWTESCGKNCTRQNGISTQRGLL